MMKFSGYRFFSLVLVASLLVCCVSTALAVPIEDDFSTNTASDYTFSNSSGTGGSFNVSGGTLNITTASSNTASALRSVAELEVGERYSITLPNVNGSSPSRHAFAVVSTTAAQPNAASSFGFRLRRDPSFKLQPYLSGSSTTSPVLFEANTPTTDAARITIERASDTIFRFYVGPVGGEQKLVRMHSNPQLAGVPALHVGMQGFGNPSQVFAFDDLSITPIDTTGRLLFQQGVNGYAGTVDTYLDSSAAGTSQASNGRLRVLNPGATQAHALLRFDDLFGNGPNQIPYGSIIHSATLSLQTGDNASDGTPSTAVVDIHRLLLPFSESDTWNSSFGSNGVQANGLEAAMLPDDSIDQEISPGELVQFDVTESLQLWAAGQVNHGWLLTQNGGNDWFFSSSEGFAPPLLEVQFTRAPEPTTWVIFLIVVCGAILAFRVVPLPRKQ